MDRNLRSDMRKVEAEVEVIVKIKKKRSHKSKLFMSKKWKIINNFCVITYNIKS